MAADNDDAPATDNSADKDGTNDPSAPDRRGTYFEAFRYCTSRAREPFDLPCLSSSLRRRRRRRRRPIFYVATATEEKVSSSMIFDAMEADASAAPSKTSSEQTICYSQSEAPIAVAAVAAFLLFPHLLHLLLRAERRRRCPCIRCEESPS